jgi:FKBP-type peptidyl-prolyl cis-trans isomerase
MTAVLVLICIVLIVLLLSKMGKHIKPAIPAPEDVAAAPADALTHGDGLRSEGSIQNDMLRSKVLSVGHGSRKPSATSEVTVHYTGWTTDGAMFDSSITRGAPATFKLNQVIPGWREGVQLMVEGESRRFWIPEPLAYPRGPGPRGTLVFDVLLIQIND